MSGISAVEGITIANYLILALVIKWILKTDTPLKIHNLEVNAYSKYAVFFGVLKLFFLSVALWVSVENTFIWIVYSSVIFIEAFTFIITLALQHITRAGHKKQSHVIVPSILKGVIELQAILIFITCIVYYMHNSDTSGSIATVSLVFCLIERFFLKS